MIWQPIETYDAAGIPDETDVLLYATGYGEATANWPDPQQVVGYRYTSYDGASYWSASMTDYYQVTLKPTHWMPLSQPPAQEEG